MATRTLVLVSLLLLPACAYRPVQDNDIRRIERVVITVAQELDVTSCKKKVADVDVRRERVRVACK